MATISKLMQQLQTRLVDDGVSLEDAALAVEYGVAWHCCTYTKGSVSKKLRELIERPGREALPGLFVFGDSPEDHRYWANIAWRGAA
jgi:hypothetical protein